MTLVCKATQPASRMQGAAWWRVRFERTQAELRAGEFDLVWIGDSIVQRFQMAGGEPWLNYRPIWREFYKPRNAINLGFGGDTTANLLWRIEQHDFTRIRPRLTILLIGTNNFAAGRRWDATATSTAIEMAAAGLLARLPGTHLVLLGILPSVRGEWVDEHTRRVNEMLSVRYAGSEAVDFVDLSDLVTRDGAVDKSCFVDWRTVPPEPPLHPTAQTQRCMAEAIEPLVARLMGDKSAA